MKKLALKIIPPFLLAWYHLLWAFLSALRYGFPSRKLVVIGVTGTNGKSTTVDMIARVLEAGGKKTASFSSIRFRVGDKEQRNIMKMTMPGRFFLQKMLKEAAKQGCGYAVVEVTSEGILQSRHRFINFHTAVFTNLSPEHIERHGSFENYRNAKGKLFQSAKKAHILNNDDEHLPFFLQFPAAKKVLYGFQEKSSAEGAFVQGRGIESFSEGTRFFVEDKEVSLKLHGAFNASNALSAIATGFAHGISLEAAKEALEQMDGIPGRMEEVAQHPFRVVVDYAFTPAALEKVYAQLKPKEGSLVCVLGAAGGGRDRWKRPVLGEIASRHCSAVFVTNEDPYEEDPVKIMEEVAAGTQGKAQIIEDRREAIAAAFKLARPGDVVIITGKGSEDSIAQGGRKIPWDDRIVVREELAKLYGREGKDMV